jgi:cytochrome c biogenesis protein
MTVLEGETNDTLTLRGTTQQKKLDFSVRCDDFEVTYYEGSRRPKDFKSDLVIIDGGKEVIKKTIEVNDPLSYKGVYIYQSSYGTAPGQGAVLIGVQPTSGEKKTTKYKVNIGERFALEKPGYEVVAKRFIPDFTMSQNNEAASRSREPRNPAVQLALYKNNTLIEEKWIFIKFPDFHEQEKGEFTFSFLNFFGREYTGLQLTKDPGVWVVWTGCFMLTLGCCLIFFMSHQRLWIKVKPKKGGEYIVTMAGTSNKNQESFKRTFELAHQELKKIGKASSNA